MQDLFDKIPPEIGRRFQEELSDNTAGHRCTHCGECCSDTIALVKTDVTRIKAYIRSHNIKPEQHTKLLGPVAQPHIVDAVCPFCRIEQFRSADKPQRANCTIYPVRPAVCRAFTCEISSSKNKLDDIYRDLQKTLTKQELAELAKTVPTSMRGVFFPDT